MSPLETAIRILVVGTRPFADRIRELLDDCAIEATVETVPGYLTALAHIGKNDPPSVLIGRVEELDEPFKPVAQSLRQMLPHSRLLLFCEPHHEQTRCEPWLRGLTTIL